MISYFLSSRFFIMLSYLRSTIILGMFYLRSLFIRSSRIDSYYTTSSSFPRIPRESIASRVRGELMMSLYETPFVSRDRSISRMEICYKTYKKGNKLTFKSLLPAVVASLCEYYTASTLSMLILVFIFNQK